LEPLYGKGSELVRRLIPIIAYRTYGNVVTGLEPRGNSFVARAWTVDGRWYVPAAMSMLYGAGLDFDVEIVRVGVDGVARALARRRSGEILGFLPAIGAPRFRFIPRTLEVAVFMDSAGGDVGGVLDMASRALAAPQYARRELRRRLEAEGFRFERIAVEEEREVTISAGAGAYRRKTRRAIYHVTAPAGDSFYAPNILAAAIEAADFTGGGWSPAQNDAAAKEALFFVEETIEAVAGAWAALSSREPPVPILPAPEHPTFEYRVGRVEPAPEQTVTLIEDPVPQFFRRVKVEARPDGSIALSITLPPNPPALLVLHLPGLNLAPLSAWARQRAQPAISGLEEAVRARAKAYGLDAELWLAVAAREARATGTAITPQELAENYRRGYLPAHFVMRLLGHATELLKTMDRLRASEILYAPPAKLEDVAFGTRKNRLRSQPAG